MNVADVRRAPDVLSWGTPSTRYRRLDALVAEHDRPVGAPAQGAHLVLDDGRIAVWKVPPQHAVSGRLGPVYGSGDDERHGHVAVPTGRILVRFAPASDAVAHAPDIARAGFDIESVPKSAPHAAWVHAASRDIADALRSLTALGAIAGVVAVEPQMLLPRATR